MPRIRHSFNFLWIKILQTVLKHYDSGKHVAQSRDPRLQPIGTQGTFSLMEEETAVKSNHAQVYHCKCDKSREREAQRTLLKGNLMNVCFFL